MKADFTIVTKPNYIKFDCPKCGEEVKIWWKDVCEPDYWGDSWGSYPCSECGEEIELDYYELEYN
jgi:predicted RNA-binding Zn-ribbon protein involved in translation (DUF1610 family)